ncbi:phage holin [Lacticaseibacillus saniviri]
MNQQTSNLITQALVLLIGAIFTYYQQHRAKVDAVVKDNQAAKTALDVVNKTADFVVHQLETGDLDNKQKQANAVNTIKTTLTMLGLPTVPENVIAGAVESAVSAMHLAYETANTPVAINSSITGAADLDGASVASQIGEYLKAQTEQGGGPMNG